MIAGKLLIGISTLLLCCLPTVRLQAENTTTPDFLQIGNQTYYLEPSLRFYIENKTIELSMNRRNIEFMREDILTQLNFVEEHLEKHNVPSVLYAIALKESNYLQLNQQQKELRLWQVSDNLINSLRLKSNKLIDAPEHLGKVSEELAIFLRSNHAKINNWLFTILLLDKNNKDIHKQLLEVQKRSPSTQYISLDDNINPYLREFLVYYNLIENEKKKVKQNYHLVQRSISKSTSLKRLAKIYGQSLEDLQRYNPWLKSKKVPSSKDYPLIVRENLKAPVSWRRAKHPMLPPPYEQPPPVVTPHTDKSENDPNPQNNPLDYNNEGINDVQNNEQQPQKNKAEVSGNNPPNKKQTDLLPKPADNIAERDANEPQYLSNYHTVRSKETLYSIANKYGMTPKRLAALNNILDLSRIYAGQRLRLRENLPLEVGQETDNNIYHLVKPGETLYRISRRYNVDLQAIKQANQLESVSRIRAGQKLLIPQAGILSDTPAETKGGIKLQSPHSNPKQVIHQKDYHKKNPNYRMPSPK